MQQCFFVQLFILGMTFAGLSQANQDSLVKIIVSSSLLCCSIFYWIIIRHSFTKICDDLFSTTFSNLKFFLLFVSFLFSGFCFNKNNKEHTHTTIHNTTVVVPIPGTVQCVQSLIVNNFWTSLNTFKGSMNHTKLLSELTTA